MTAVIALVNLNGDVKRDITILTAVPTTTFITDVIPENYVAFVLDDTSINVDTIHSGLLYPALQDLRDKLLENSELFTNLAVGEAIMANCKSANPKLSPASIQVVADPDATAISTVFTSGKNVGLVVNKPTNLTTGGAFVSAGYLADYIKEQLN